MRRQVKTGNLAMGHKEPPSYDGVGLDWAAIEKKRAERLEEEYARGIRHPDVLEHMRLKHMTEQQLLEEKKKREARAAAEPVKKSPSRSAQRKGGQRKGARSDVEKIVELYTEKNLSPKEIELQLGTSYGTIIRWLKDRGVFDPNRHRKAPVRPKESYTRQKRCSKGHDLTKPGASRERTKVDGSPNGIECVECARERGRRNWHKRKENS